jgi:hypothetical protein
MLKPEFPYKEDQIILSSNRVVLHSKKDAIFVFGKEAIGLSSTKTINLDANEKVLIACNKIELGYRAEEEGEPVVLGNKLNRELILLMESLINAGGELSKASSTNLGSTMTAIHTAGVQIASACNRLKVLLERTDSSGNVDSPILSKNTFTK